MKTSTLDSFRSLVLTLFALSAVGAALAPGAALAQTGTAPPVASVDYADGDSWLCRPSRQDACAIDLTATVIRADGTTARESWSADPAAPIDCFYVYPTISTDPSPNSDMTADEAERRVIAQQFARFASVCRPYAPMYRQVTLAGLRTRLSGGGSSLEEGIQYDDVRDAFRHYLANDNGGRGFVLVSHSQGTWILTRLVQEEIEGRPVQGQLVSALLIGAAVTVANGRDVGGSFTDIPLCRSPSQTGCVVAYSAFRSTAPPPENTRFGRAAAEGQSGACVNPAALGGGSAELHAYLSTGGSTIVGARRVGEWVAGGAAVETPFVSVPGLLTARCASNEHATYLEVTVHGDPSDPRADDIVGDLTPDWGLHLVDMNIAMGNLIDVVRRQSAAYREGR